MDGSEVVEITALTSIDEIDAQDWDRCADPEGAPGQPPENPFLTHRFLKALEDSRSVGRGSGWAPRHLVARLGERVIGVMPLYAKGHSQGEYVFDHSWAHAYERAGGDYYPKLQGAVPFTPATGRRFLVAPGETPAAVVSALVQGAVQLTASNGLSSLHVTFCTEAEWEMGAEIGLLQRTGEQFHWRNRGYADFEAFLADLSSRKRKNIRRERREATASGLTIRALTGDDLRPEHWDAFWRFYQDTGSRKWGSPYLTRDFFNRVQESLRDETLLVLAERDGRPVAGALNFIGRRSLFGRYWGCTEHHPCLHFELCYYQAIDFAIAQGLETVEAGAQGEHKLARGYLPVKTHSLHWIADPNFRRAVAEYLDAEREAVGDEIAWLSERSPFRKSDLTREIEEHD
ncbi:GNAT family N-acetyltransferase [Albimonas sp. CAU 1670]|uniref:GNAT family N-acetyltransferase n=1 Tax=Albimonas sp. CAU 1670 TaxID=3032599 RepID=UPI0023DAE2FE|nr:GNAT family N-acetyltransferase [Albimonas sp. CAU 1670]MDF2233528.1 GNAT family N-acetyltransferase [Albimonas sp. CAU 1670]